MPGRIKNEGTLLKDTHNSKDFFSNIVLFLPILYFLYKINFTKN